MSDTEPKTPNKTGASGAAWSDGEKIAYLILLCETDGKKAESKISSAPVPDGRSLVSCRKLLLRLKEKHKDDMEKIKAGMALAPVTTAGDNEDTPAPEKAKTPRKRKTKAEKDGEDDALASPKKKATPRKKKNEPVKEEDVDDESKEKAEDAMEA